MTDERMTQGDVRLREELLAVLGGMRVRALVPEHGCGGDEAECYRSCPIPIEVGEEQVADALAPAVERIVAARVGEALAPIWELKERWSREVKERGTGDMIFTGGAAIMLGTALRAADAPLTAREDSGGHGDAGDRAGGGE